MSSDERLNKLLLEYEEQRQRGTPVAPEQLCHDHPDLLEEFRKRLEELASIDRLLAQTTGSEDKGPCTLPTIPGFEVLEELGRGGMGVVYKARQLSLGRLVALKLVLSGAHASAQDRARLRSEAEALARLRHPHIAQIHDVATHDGRPFLVLEYVDGTSLDKRAQRCWPARQAAELVERVARALDAAHQCRMVHRDLKPSNILFTADGTPKVVDFGLVKLLDEGSGPTRTGAILGTPSYMAPEQAAGGSEGIGPWTDVYALGVILYELLTGRPPFKTDSVWETLEQVRSHEPTPPRRLQTTVPHDLETICLQALHKEPARRYLSAQELADDLGRWLRGEAVRAQARRVWHGVWRWLGQPERIHEAGLVMLCHAALRLLNAGMQVSHYLEVAEDDDGWSLLVTSWSVGVCISVAWAGWRALGGHGIALWAGLALAVVYLANRATMLPVLSESSYPYLLFFLMQLLSCAVGLLAYYRQQRG